MVKRIFTYILCLPILIQILSQNTLAQEQKCKYVLSGRVIDEHDESILEYATVFVQELNRGASADENGRFTISNLCPGTYSIRVSHVSCKTRIEQVEVLSDTKKVLFLEHHVLGLDEVSVVGHKIENANSRTKSSLTQKELTKKAGLSLGESMKSLTGVTTLQSGPAIAKPVIHGLHSNRIVILNNGVRQEGQQWGAEHGPEIDPYVANKITVIKGAEAVRYGADAIGGIVLVEAQDLMNTSGFIGNINLNGMSNGRRGSSSVRLEGGFDNGFGWRVQSSYTRSGDANTSEYQLSNTGVKELNFSGAIGYRNDHLTSEVFYSRFNSNVAILRSAHIGNLTDLTNAINSARPTFIEEFSYEIDHPKQEVTHDLIKGKINWNLRNEFKLKAQYAIQIDKRDEFDRRRGDNFNRPSISLQLATHTYDLILEHKPLGKMMGEIGISGIWQRNSNQAGTNAKFLIPDFKSSGIGVHMIEKFILNDFELEAGLRFDHRKLKPLIFDTQLALRQPVYTFNNFTASLGGSVRLSDQLTFRTHIATAWRPPHVSELFSNGLHHGAASIEEGLLIENGVLSGNFEKAELNSENAIKWVSALNFTAVNWDFEINPYYNRINNYYYLTPHDIRLTIRGAFPVFRYVSTDADFVGVDLKLNYKLSDQWSYLGKASFLRARDITKDDVLIYIPANNIANEITYTPEQIANFNETYFTLGVQSTLQQRRAPETFIDFEGSDIPDHNFDFKDAPDGYMLLNFEFGFSQPINRQKLQFGFSVQNILNTSYRDYMNRFRYYADDLGRNFTIRLNYQF